jgi:ribonuclease-3
MNPEEEEILQRAEAILNYRFNNPAFMREALTHSSVVDDHLASNERLEFLGDAILGFVVCEHLFQRYPDQREGELTKIKSAVVSRRACAMISDRLGLTGLLTLGKGMGSAAGLPESLSAAVYESVVGAIYLDGGMEPARQFILDHMTAVIDEAAESTHQDNYKSVLQQYAQRHLSDLPTYLLLDEKGPDHAKCFEVCVEMGGRRFTSAWGQSKKQAEQSAALRALRILGVLYPLTHRLSRKRHPRLVPILSPVWTTPEDLLRIGAAQDKSVPRDKAQDQARGHAA